MAGKKKIIDEAATLAKRLLSAEPEVRKITGAELLKKTEGLSEDPFKFSKFAKPLNEMEYTVTKSAVPMEPYKTVDPYDLVKRNALIAGHISDRSAAGRNLVGVSDTELTEPLLQRGGADYQRTTLNAWANRPGAAKGLNRKLNEASGFEWDAKSKQFVPAKGGPEEAPLYTTPVFMGASSANSSHMVGVPLIRMIPNLPISKADKLAFDAMMSERYPGWPGIDKTKEAENFMYSGKIPGSAISRFVKYASGKKWKGAGFPDTSELMFSAMDPRLVGVPQGSTGFGLKEFRPGEKPIVRTNDYHPDYPAAIPGKEYAGGFKYQVPQHLMFSDWWKTLKPELQLPENATKAQHTLMTQVPIQRATPEWADKILQYWEDNPMPWGYADGGEVDDDIDDAMRIARAEGGRAGYATDGAVQPPVMMEDAKGNKYDAQGNVIPQDNTGANPQRSDVAPQQNAMFNTAPQNYAQDVQPLIDYAVTPIDRPGMPSEPDLVNVMRIATQVAAEGQPTDSRGEGNLARRREELVNKLYGANEDPNSPSSNQAWVMNRAIDFTPYSLFEIAHDIPYEAGRTGDYKTAAIEGGLNAALTSPVLGAAGRGIKKGYELAKQFPKVTAGIIGSGAATTGSDEAEAGPARWFSKALEVARAIPMEKMTGEQALAMLRKGTSPEELRWMGAEPFLSGQKSVSKDDLVAFLEKNRVQPKEITLGGSGKPTRREDVKPDSDIVAKYVGKRDQAYKEYNEINQQIKQAADAEQWGRVENLKLLASDKYREYNGLTEKMIDDQIARMGGLGTRTKYEDYSTPGGQGYRETLYQYGTGLRPEVKNVNGMWSVVGPDGNVMRSSNGSPYTYWSEDAAKAGANSLYRTSGSYTSSHWDDPDVLFHTRSQTLDVTPPGANRPYKAHNVDETQSDLGQAGRKSGFRDQDYEPRIKQINADLFAAEGEYRVKQQAIKDAYRREQEKVDVLSANEEMALVQALRRREIKPLEYEDGLANLVEKYRPMRTPSYQKYNEQMKRLDDTLGARMGALKNERANLNIEQSKMPAMPFVGSTEGWTDRAIKHELDKALDSEADYFTWSPGDVHADRYSLDKHIGALQYEPMSQTLYAYDKQGSLLMQETATPDKLPDYIGREAAEKLLATKTDTLNRTHILGGLDLKVGGEGMRGYYDKVYLKRVQEVLRKATGEKPNIEVIEVQTANGPRKQLGVRLTDEMREKARFSDFNKGGRVTGGDTYDNDQAVAHALALTSEY